ncbi:type II secretory pathway pseudopilin PulG [Streptacidiphilus sp. MAP12-33]|uniref:hypothetical protein n=1 Tax=Streptacidiphilus sp. MAP12-33 TaxID=3156266 RepID=UPI0035135CDF
MSSSSGAPTAPSGSAPGEVAAPKVKGGHVEVKVARLGLVAVLVAAVLAAGASLYTAWEQSKVQVQLQNAQAAADRAQSDRDKRTDVYGKFLQAANAYAAATDNLLAYVDANCKPGSRCSPNFSTLETTKAAFQGSINDVSVWGSNAAVKDEAAVAATLPPSMWSTDELDLKFNHPAFTQAYQAFLVMMCHELPADPRSGCR